MTNSKNATSSFYGWRIVAASFFTLGLSVGLPYFGMTFFYDYFEQPIAQGGFGWTRSVITFGLPLGTLLTLWVGPVLVPCFTPRKLILLGTGCTALTFFGFGTMTGAVWMYWALWLLYMIGNVFSGGLTHQMLLVQWFHKKRGVALSIAYLGISFIGAISSRFLVKPITENYGFRTALIVMGCMQFLTWPLVLFVFKDRPAQLGLHPDGLAPSNITTLEQKPAMTFSEIFRARIFWIILLGGTFISGAIGAISLHLKLIFKDAGFSNQQQLNAIFSQTLMLLLIVSAASRLVVGWLADRFPKQHVLSLMILLFASSVPFLLFLQPARPTYFFPVLFGLAVGGDFLIVALIAADYFSPNSLARMLAIILAVMTLGQTWFPYFISLLRELSSTYTIPLLLIIVFGIAGRLIIFLLPKSQNSARTLQTGQTIID